jgi:hypothetical protein
MGTAEPPPLLDPNTSRRINNPIMHAQPGCWHHRSNHDCVVQGGVAEGGRRLLLLLLASWSQSRRRRRLAVDALLHNRRVSERPCRSDSASDNGHGGRTQHLSRDWGPGPGPGWPRPKEEAWRTRQGGTVDLPHYH